MADARGGPPLARPATPPSSLAAPLPARISYTEPALTGGLGRGVLGSALRCPQLLLQLCRDALATAAATAAAVRGGGRHVTADLSFPAPLPTSLRSLSPRRGSGREATPAAPPSLTGRETRAQRGVGTSPGLHSQTAAVLGALTDNFRAIEELWGERHSSTGDAGAGVERDPLVSDSLRLLRFFSTPP